MEFLDSKLAETFYGFLIALVVLTSLGIMRYYEEKRDDKKQTNS